MKIFDKIKNVVNIVLEFTTGLGFYGLGLLLAGLAVWIIIGWDHIGSCLIGAFVFKNFKSIVDHIKSIKV